MLKHNLVAVSAATFALFGTTLLLPTIEPSSNSIISRVLPSISVQAADAAYRFDASWNDAESSIKLNFENPGSFGQGARSQIRFKVNGNLEDFKNGDLGIYIGNTQTRVVKIDENSEGYFILSEIVDTDAILNKFFTIRSQGVNADFTLDIVLVDSQGAVVSDTHHFSLEITADGAEIALKNQSTTPLHEEESDESSASDNSATAASEPVALQHPSTTDAPTCGDAKPAIAPELFQIDMNGTTATLYWSPGSTDITSYFIAYGQNPSNLEHGVVVENVDHNGVNSFEIRDLQPGTKYYFSVRAQNGGMPGDWSSALAAQAQPTDAPKKVYYKYE